MRKFSVQLYFCLVEEGLFSAYVHELAKRYPSVAHNILPGYATLTLVLESDDKEQLFLFKKEVLYRYGDSHYESPQGKIEEAVHAWFVEHRKKLAFAESCTGGLLSALVTALPGASDYFLGSLVVYSQAMKQNILGVSRETLHSTGDVSAETVTEMLDGVFKHTGADYAIAVSGIAGPSGGTEKTPVGTIWAAVGQREKSPHVGTFQVKGDRHHVIHYTAHFLLASLWKKVEKGLSPFPN